MATASTEVTEKAIGYSDRRTAAEKSAVDAYRADISRTVQPIGDTIYTVAVDLFEASTEAAEQARESVARIATSALVLDALQIAHARKVYYENVSQNEEEFSDWYSRAQFSIQLSPKGALLTHDLGSAATDEVILRKITENSEEIMAKLDVQPDPDDMSALQKYVSSSLSDVWQAPLKDSLPKGSASQWVESASRSAATGFVSGVIERAKAISQTSEVDSALHNVLESISSGQGKESVARLVEKVHKALFTANAVDSLANRAEGSTRASTIQSIAYAVASDHALRMASKGEQRILARFFDEQRGVDSFVRFSRNVIKGASFIVLFNTILAACNTPPPSIDITPIPTDDDDSQSWTPTATPRPTNTPVAEQVQTPVGVAMTEGSPSSPLYPGDMSNFALGGGGSTEQTMNTLKELAPGDVKATISLFTQELIRMGYSQQDINANITFIPDLDPGKSWTILPYDTQANQFLIPLVDGVLESDLSLFGKLDQSGDFFDLVHVKNPPGFEDAVQRLTHDKNSGWPVIVLLHAESGDAIGFLHVSSDEWRDPEGNLLVDNLQNETEEAVQIDDSIKPQEDYEEEENGYKYEYTFNAELGQGVRQIGSVNLLDYPYANFLPFRIFITDGVDGERSIMDITHKDDVPGGTNDPTPLKGILAPELRVRYFAEDSRQITEQEGQTIFYQEMEAQQAFISITLSNGDEAEVKLSKSTGINLTIMDKDTLLELGGENVSTWQVGETTVYSEVYAVDEKGNMLCRLAIDGSFADLNDEDLRKILLSFPSNLAQFNHQGENYGTSLFSDTVAEASARVQPGTNIEDMVITRAPQP